MVSGTSWNALEQRISNAVKLPRRPVAVGFLDAVPSGLEQFQGNELSGCSFWQLATAGRSFFTVPENHFNCAVERTPTPFDSPRRPKKETGSTLKIMFDVGYLKPEEVPRISCLSKTPAAIAYAPLGDAANLRAHTG